MQFVGIMDGVVITDDAGLFDAGTVVLREAVQFLGIMDGVVRTDDARHFDPH